MTTNGHTDGYLHICSRCGRDFYTDSWYAGVAPLCPDCAPMWRRQPARDPDSAWLLRRSAAAAERERLDREYAENPPRTVVTVVDGVRVERRGTVPSGANSGSRIVPPPDGRSLLTCGGGFC